MVNILADARAAAATAGARLSRAFTLAAGARDGWSLIPEVRAAAQFELLDDDAAVTARFAGFGTPFDLAGADTPDVADYNGRFANDQTDHQFSLALQFPF